MPEFVSEALGEGHDLARFRCGVPSLDRWLAEHARHAESNRTARTYVWRRDDGEVVAYYSLAAHEVLREAVPRSVGRGSPERIPAVLIGRLALGEALHGRRLGSELLADALRRCVTAGAAVGARLVAVDAIDERAAGFYEAHGFRRIPGRLRLVREMSGVAADLGAA